MRRTRLLPDEREAVIQRFDACAFARLLGMEVVEVCESGVRVAMDATGRENAFGTAHGGAVFALADHAFGIAANMDGVPQTTLSAHIRYLAPAAGPLEAVARRVSETERTSVFEVLVYAAGRLIASFEGVGFKV